MIVVRDSGADDTVVGFEHRADAERFLAELCIRMAEFALELHPEKTRLIAFGRRAAAARAARGEGKPETFDFLGFTHICARTRRGGFLLARHTRRDRKRAKLLEITEDLRRRWHQDIAEQGRWLGSGDAGLPPGQARGHASPTMPCPPTRVPSRRSATMSSTSGDAPCAGAARRTGRLGRHGQAGQSLAAQAPDIPPLAGSALPRQTPKVGAVCGNAARTVLCGGRPVMRVPTAIETTECCWQETRSTPWMRGTAIGDGFPELGRRKRRREAGTSWHASDVTGAQKAR